LIKHILTTKIAKVTKQGGFETRPYIFGALCTAILKSLRSLRKFSDCYSSWMQHMMKDIFTTKITKATKGPDIFAHKLRALRVLRGQICLSFLIAA
jgi:hypothetical protein